MLGGVSLFAEILKKLRKEKKLNQREFAREVFISPSAVSQYETGRTMPSRETLERIARYFGVSADYLMGTSTIAEVEELMNQDYCNGVTISDLIKKLITIQGNDRDTLLVLVDALQMHSNQRK